MQQKSSAVRERNRRGEGDRLRAEILAATARLLEAAGSDEGLSLRGVAREVGISPQSMYLHFANLDELVLAVLADSHGLMGRDLDAAADAEADPVERVIARGRAYLAWGAAHPGLYQVMYEGRLQSKPELEPGVLPPGRTLLYKVRDDVRAAMAAGAIPDGDAESLAYELWALVHGLVSLRANKPAMQWPDTGLLVDDAGRRILRAP
ncbi:MAG TPA: TetR/AcrR family transcriptional regulator [Mycobacteriales bacterium]|jgi:AcrR family transcriptional regulator|nr:TetR/AcrR family transcriptional regulator [Mycobacteriales bacterium]